jgi:hypothetical protein
MLLRPENGDARNHIEENVAEYAQWLVRFHLLDGSTELLGPGNGAFFVKRGCSLYSLATLADTLVKCGFTVVKDDNNIRNGVRTSTTLANANSNTARAFTS